MSIALRTPTSSPQQEAECAALKKGVTVKKAPRSANSCPQRNCIQLNDNFPQKLHRILDAIQDDGHDSVLSWLSHGRAIKVHKPRVFAEEIIFPYFGMVKASSFTRQLNIYGFCRVTGGPDRGSYYHPFFLRGHPELAWKITRQEIKGTGVGRKKETPSCYPDFDAMPPLKKEKTIKRSGRSSWLMPPEIVTSSPQTTPAPKSARKLRVPQPWPSATTLAAPALSPPMGAAVSQPRQWPRPEPPPMRVTPTTAKCRSHGTNVVAYSPEIVGKAVTHSVSRSSVDGPLCSPGTLVVGIHSYYVVDPGPIARPNLFDLEASTPEINHPTSIGAVDPAVVASLLPRGAVGPATRMPIALRTPTLLSRQEREIVAQLLSGSHSAVPMAVSEGSASERRIFSKFN